MTPLKFATQMYSVRTGLLRMSLKPELLEKRKSDLCQGTENNNIHSRLPFLPLTAVAGTWL